MVRIHGFLQNSTGEFMDSPTWLQIFDHGGISKWTKDIQMQLVDI